MVTLEINGAAKADNDITEKWISERFRLADNAGRLPCVRFTIDTADCKLTFATAACGGGGGLGRALNAHEISLVGRWEQAHLNAPRYTAGNVISFFKHLKDVF